MLFLLFFENLHLSEICCAISLFPSVRLAPDRHLHVPVSLTSPTTDQQRKSVKVTIGGGVVDPLKLNGKLTAYEVQIKGVNSRVDLRISPTRSRDITTWPAASHTFSGQRANTNIEILVTPLVGSHRGTTISRTIKTGTAGEASLSLGHFDKINAVKNSGKDRARTSAPNCPADRKHFVLSTQLIPNLQLMDGSLVHLRPRLSNRHEVPRRMLIKDMGKPIGL